MQVIPRTRQGPNIGLAGLFILIIQLWWTSLFAADEASALRLLTRLLQPQGAFRRWEGGRKGGRE